MDVVHGGSTRFLLKTTEMISPQTKYDDLFRINQHALGLDTTLDSSSSSSSSSAHLAKLQLDTFTTRVTSNASTNSGNSSSSSSSSCEGTYGFLPCTNTVVGNLFLLAAYGYLLFRAAGMLSEGSELLLTVLDAGLIGGLLLPILGALPDSILILVSGLGGTKAEAQEQVLVGIGLLAGSIVMLLTALWGSCLILGRCDLEVVDGKMSAIDKQLSKPFGLSDTGVENDDLTMLSARIMILSIVPFIVAQLPKIFQFSASGNIPVLIACVLSLCGLIGYCLYQVFTPWIQERRKVIAQKMVYKILALEKLVRRTGVVDKLVDDHGNVDGDVAERLFHKIDRNKDGSVSYDELRVMLSMSLKDGKGSEEIMEHFMAEFDENRNNMVSLDEFLKGLQKWCKVLELKPEHSIEDHRKHAESFLDELLKVKEEDENDEENNVLTKSQIIRKAILLLVGGTIVAAVFADPLVDAVNAFSSASNIPSFFISFVLLPLASNSSEAVSSIMFSARKKKENMSLTYSQIYGGVTMNSTMGLGIFLAVVYGRQLVWDFSSEVLVICLVTVVMGLMASFRKVFPLWMAGVAILLYPLSLGLVAILDYVAGWK